MKLKEQGDIQSFDLTESGQPSTRCGSIINETKALFLRIISIPFKFQQLH